VDGDLDFIVIGVQKGGTTSLWQYLRGHTLIAMPDFKEAPVFCMNPERIPATLERLTASFGDIPPEARLGKVANHYMMGMKGVNVQVIADRIARTVPKVRLIVLLRDPIERAISHYRMSVRRGIEKRPLGDALEELLEPEQLESGRTRPTEENSYLAQGEYGRILQIYHERFPAEQIHVEMTDELDRSPEQVIDRVLGFLGLPAGYRPEGLDLHHHVGGTRKRIDEVGEEQLRAFMEEYVWPELRDDDRVRMTFNFFMETWNVIPDERQPRLPQTTRGRLEAHFARDGELLTKLGFEAPWLAMWRQS
jgi:hypothetical protein